jgi:hypothetical protein
MKTILLLLLGLALVANAQIAYFAQDTLDFPSISPGTCEELTMTATGASKGATPVFCDSSANLPSNTVLYPFMSAADTITVRVCNVQSSGSINPDSMDFFCSAVEYDP